MCTRPFVSMPVGFWRDDDGSRYRDAYFADNAGVWTHGDFIEVRPEGGVVIYGRATRPSTPAGFASAPPRSIALWSQSRKSVTPSRSGTP